MKNKKGFLGTLSIILLMVVLQKSPVEAQPITAIKIVGNHAPPYRIIQGDTFSGIYFDVMKEIGKRIHLSVSFQEQPFERALYSMEQGTADIMVGPNKTPQRETYMVYTEATVGRARKAFYVHPDAPVIGRYEDLKGRRVIVHRGKSYFDKFDRDSSLEKVVADSYEQAFKMIVGKRAEVVIVPELEGDYLLKKLGIVLQKSPLILEGNQSYIVISKKSPAIRLQNEIEEAMAQIASDGTLDKILSGYGGSGSPQPKVGVSPDESASQSRSRPAGQ